MNKLLPIAVAASVAAISAPASAATVVVDSSTYDVTNLFPVSGDSADSPTNSISITHSSNPSDPTIDEVLEFTISDALFAVFGFSSSPGEPPFNFTLYELTGPGGFTRDLSSVINGTPMGVSLSAPGQYTLTLEGTNGFTAVNGSYNGNITFQAVPEPGTWLMLLLGFFGMGMVLRREQGRKTQQSLRVTYS